MYVCIKTTYIKIFLTFIFQGCFTICAA